MRKQYNPDGTDNFWLTDKPRRDLISHSKRTLALVCAVIFLAFFSATVATVQSASNLSKSPENAQIEDRV